MSQESLGGQFKAWVRGGAKDLYNAAIPAFPQSLHPVDEPGTPLNPTPQMVTADLGGSYQEFLSRYQDKARETNDTGREREL